MPIRIRPALPSDLDWLIEQLKEFDKFAAYGRSLIEDEAHARTGVIALICNHVTFIAEDRDERIGFIAAYKTGHPFNPKIRVLSECFWWVTPGNRKSRAGLMLLHELMEYGHVHSDWIVMSLENVSPVKGDCLIKRGFVHKESSFLMEV